MKSRNLKLFGILLGASFFATGCIPGKDNAHEYESYRKAGGRLTFWEWQQAGSPNEPLIKNKDISVVSTSYDEKGHLILHLSNGQVLDAGVCPTCKSDVYYSVTFHCGDTVFATVEVQTGEKVAKPQFDAIDVDNWYLDPEKSKKWDFDKDVVDKNIDLYGDISSKKQCFVSFVDNDLNTGLLNQNFLYGRPYTLPTPFDYSGKKVFTSWKTNDGREVPLTGEEWNFPNHTTLYANWHDKEGFDADNFGFYPQTVVKDKELIKQLERLFEAKKGETIPRHTTGVDKYHYANDTHLEYGGFRYERFDWEEKTSSEECYFRGNVKFSDVHSKNNVYYFKIEPIQWDVFKTEKGETLAITKKVLEVWWAMRNTKSYPDSDGIQLNDYTYSHFRSWMNGKALSKLGPSDQYSKSLFDIDFLISKEEKDMIIPHFGDDKLFLLNRDECKKLKEAKGTLKGESNDRALAFRKSVKVSSGQEYMEWVTRDGAASKENMWRVDEKGEFDDSYIVDTWSGVRPAIKIDPAAIKVKSK